MELPKLKEKFQYIIQKYKFILLILCVGVILILLPNKNEKAGYEQTSAGGSDVSHISQDNLADILERISGVGHVEVMLSIETSEQMEYQVNKDSTAISDGRLTTVTVTDSQRNESGLITQRNAPTYRGAIIVCDGADNPIVQLSVVEAVSNITGLRADQISVLKMK